MRHIFVSNLSIIGSDNGLSLGRRQPIVWNNAGILVIWPLGTNVRAILLKILTFSFNKMPLNVLSAGWRPFCHTLNVSITLSLNGCRCIDKQPITMTPTTRVQTEQKRPENLTYVKTYHLSSNRLLFYLGNNEITTKNKPVNEKKISIVEQHVLGLLLHWLPLSCCIYV